VTVFVGTSGWQYDSWRGKFYPEKLPKSRWLEHYATRFRTVEVNNTFYRLPGPDTFAEWARRTPDGFVIVPKLSRYLSHIKRLRDPEEPVQRFLEHSAPLGAKRGPLLLQLPPDFQTDVGRLDAALAQFPRDVRVAVEFRHRSWYADDVCAVLDRHNAALVLADRASRPTGPLWRTADWAYVRLHHGRGLPPPCYGRGALRAWAQRLRELWGSDADAYVFFNNDGRACAPRDAARFERLVARDQPAPKMAATSWGAATANCA